MNTDAGGRIVFLDLDAVPSRDGLVRAVTEAVKHPANPVLPLGDVHEWDGLQANLWGSRTVIYDEEDRVFKAWYQGTDLSMERWWATGYATSDDGVHWDKPRLGRHEYRGSTDNNICSLGFGPVIKDAAEPDPSKRYKFVAKGPPWPNEVRLLTSPDGIAWDDGVPITLPEWEGRTPDVVVILRDETEPDPDRRCKLVWQSTVRATKPGPERVRAKQLAYGPDFEHLRHGDFNPILSPNDGREQENHFLMLAPHHGGYVMAYEYGWYVPNPTGNFGQYAADIRLAYSRDGEHFERVEPDQKLIARGARTEFDSQALVIAHQPVVTNDTIYLYYGSAGDDWSSWPASNTPEAYRWSSTGSVRVSRLGLATLPVDGYTHLRTRDGETPGSAITRPIDRSRHDVDLIANLDRTLSRRDWVEVEVLDPETDKPLSGFGRDDCNDLDRDGVRVRVHWGERSLADVAADRFRLRIWIAGAARLFALGFEART